MLLQSIQPLPKRSLLLGLLGGLWMVAVFWWGYRQMNPDHYVDRDDGVITMSHARNWVDCGFIGVEPSGQRVEGFSAPLQFWLYAAAYRLTGMGWHVFGKLQTNGCAFLIGFFFLRCWDERPRLGILLTIGLGWWLTHQLRFFAWHGSGMENALLHAGMAVLLWAGKKAMDTGKMPLYTSIVLGMVMLVRMDTIFHLLPWSLLLAVAYGLEWRSWRGFGVVGLSLGIWGLYQIWRHAYFGEWSPNTSLAQGIDPGLNLRRLLAADMAWLREGTQYGLSNLRIHGAWILVLSLLVVPFLQLRAGNRWLILGALSLVLTAFFNPLVFGMTRLDPGRTTTFTTLMVGFVVAGCVAAVPWRRHLLSIAMAGVAVFAGGLLWPVFAERPPKLCCAIATYEGITQEALAFQDANQLHRITLATPDLGKLSYQKRFNLFDIGFLGSPIVTHLRREEDALRRYFYEFALPDVVETHGEWCLLHARILADPRFRELYTPFHETRFDYLETYGGDWPTVTEGIFGRKALLKDSLSREWQLIQAMNRQVALEPIQAALTVSVNASDPAAHQYVVRTAYRFLPEFRELGMEDALVKLFSGTPSAQYDQALLSSAHNPQWLRDALDWLLPYFKGKDQQKFQALGPKRPMLIWEKGKYRLYGDLNRRVWLSVFDPDSVELASIWQFHAFAKHPEDLSSPNPWNVENMDFSWDADCETVVASEHVYPIDLPKYPLKGLLVGRYVDGKPVFGYHVRWWVWGW